jgi:adenylate cyclase class IV
VKNLGYFLELETVLNNISKDEALIEFNSIVNFLKLNFNNQIRSSYRDLMQNKLLTIKAP